MAVYTETKCGACRKTVRVEGVINLLPENWATVTLERHGEIHDTSTVCPDCRLNVLRAMTGRKRLPKAKKVEEKEHGTT